MNRLEIVVEKNRVFTEGEGAGSLHRLYFLSRTLDGL